MEAPTSGVGTQSRGISTGPVGAGGGQLGLGGAAAGMASGYRLRPGAGKRSEEGGIPPRKIMHYRQRPRFALCGCVKFRHHFGVAAGKGMA
jgi:hypothetical protein